MEIKNLSIVRQSFANAVFTHKVQEIAAEMQARKAFAVKIVNIMMVSLVLVLLFLQTLFPEEAFISSIAEGLAISEVIFLIIQLHFSFEQRMITHKNSALKFMNLRDKYRSLIADIMNAETINDCLIARRDALQQEYQIVCDLAPQAGHKEYTRAQERLNKKGAVKDEEFTWSDEEIDRFLPEKLKLNN